MEITGIHLIGVGGAVYLFNLWGKARMDNIAKEGYCTIGRVTGHETKFQRVGGTWTWLKYPTVEYLDRDNKYRTGFIKYAKSTGTYFTVGEEVDIIVHQGTIYYQHAMNSSNYKWIAIGLGIAGLAWELNNWLN
ncbi:MAG: hypothetical protein Roseis2KO_52710 [Roseivirga sp.]